MVSWGGRQCLNNGRQRQKSILHGILMYPNSDIVHHCLSQFLEFLQSSGDHKLILPLKQFLETVESTVEPTKVVNNQVFMQH